MMKNSTRNLPKQSFQRGVSMLEVLIALLITTIGLLGFASLQSRALLSTEDTYQRTQATSLAQDIIERMRMNGIAPNTQSNTAATSSAVYTTATSWTGTTPTTDCLGMAKSCSKDDMARYDVRQIRTAVAASSNLPNGTVLVTKDALQCDSGRVCAYVAWGSTTASTCAAAKGVGVRTCVVIQGN